MVNRYSRGSVSLISSNLEEMFQNTASIIDRSIHSLVTQTSSKKRSYDEVFSNYERYSSILERENITAQLRHFAKKAMDRAEKEMLSMDEQSANDI